MFPIVLDVQKGLFFYLVNNPIRYMLYMKLSALSGCVGRIYIFDGSVNLIADANDVYLFTTPF